MQIYTLGAFIFLSICLNQQRLYPQLPTFQVEGDDSEPADDEGKEEVAEVQHWQPLLQHCLLQESLCIRISTYHKKPLLTLNEVFLSSGSFL